MSGNPEDKILKLFMLIAVLLVILVIENAGSSCTYNGSNNAASCRSWVAP